MSFASRPVYIAWFRGPAGNVLSVLLEK